MKVDDDRLLAELALIRTKGAGAPSGTGVEGQQYYDTTNDRLYLSDGVGWIIMYEPWQTYTPTTTNISNGSGFTLTGAFKRSMGWIDLVIVHNLGASSAGVITAPGPTWSFPGSVTPNFRSGNSEECGGSCQLNDASAAIQHLVPFLASGTKLEPRVVITNPADQQITNTVPITIAVNDTFVLKPRFEMSTPYL